MTINSELNNNTISSIVTKSDALIQKEPLVGKALGAQSVTPGTQAPGSRRARAIAQEILQRKPKEGNETKLQGRVAPPSPNRPPPPLPKELKKLIDEMRKRPIPPPDLKGLEIPGRGLKLEENLSSTFGIIKNRGAKLSIIGGKLTPTVGETTLENDIEVVSGVLKETKEALNKDILQFKYENQWIPLHHLLRTLASSEQGKSVLRVNKTLRRELRGVLNQAQDQQLATKVLERVKGGSKAPKEVKTLADAQHFMIHQGKIKEFLRCVETTFNHVNRTSSKLKLLSVYRSYIKGISENLFEVDHDLIDQLDKFAGKQDISKALLKDINELRHTSLDKRLAGKVYENMHTDLRLPPEVKTLNQTLKFMVYKGKAREFFESVNKTFSDAKMERSKVKLLQTCRAYLKGVREGLFREDPQLVNQIKEISQKVKNAIKKPTLSQAGGLAKLKSKLQTKLKKTLIDDRDVDRELGLQKDKVFVEAHNLTNFDIGLHYTRSEKLPKLQEKHKPKVFLGHRPFVKELNQFRNETLDSRLVGRILEKMDTHLRVPENVKALTLLDFISKSGKTREFFNAVISSYSKARSPQHQLKLLNTCRAYMKGIRDGKLKEEPKVAAQLKNFSKEVRDKIKGEALDKRGGEAKVKKELKAKLNIAMPNDRDMDRELGLEKNRVYIQAHNLLEYDIGLHYTQSTQAPQLKVRYKSYDKALPLVQDISQLVEDRATSLSSSPLAYKLKRITTTVQKNLPKIRHSLKKEGILRNVTIGGHKVDLVYSPNEENGEVYISIPEKLGGLIGKGGFKTVNLAIRTSDQKVIALSTEDTTGEDAATRERDLHHKLFEAAVPCVTKMYGSSIHSESAEKQTLFRMQKYYMGGSLEQVSKNLSLQKKLEITKEISQSVEKMHELDVVFRDYSLDNVILDEKERPFFLDFGGAQEFGPRVGPKAKERGKMADIQAFGELLEEHFGADCPPNIKEFIATMKGDMSQRPHAKKVSDFFANL